MYVIRHLLVPYKVASSGNQLVLKKRNENRFFTKVIVRSKKWIKRSISIFPPHNYTQLQTIEKLSWLLFSFVDILNSLT